MTDQQFIALVEAIGLKPPGDRYVHPVEPKWKAWRERGDWWFSMALVQHLARLTTRPTASPGR